MELLPTLPPNSQFAIGTFGSTVEFNGTSLGKVTDEKAIESAVQFAGRITADRGGSELKKALKKAIELTSGSTNSKNIILITVIF